MFIHFHPLEVDQVENDNSFFVIGNKLIFLKLKMTFQVVQIHVTEKINAKNESCPGNLKLANLPSNKILGYEATKYYGTLGGNLKKLQYFIILRDCTLSIITFFRAFFALLLSSEYFCIILPSYLYPAVFEKLIDLLIFCAKHSSIKCLLLSYWDG